MATRIPNPRFRTFNITVSGVPAGVSEKALQEILAASIAEVSTKVAVKTTKPKVAPIKLRNRVIRKSGAYACRLLPKAGAVISWPAGVPHQGCGRSFASEAQRDAHEAGYTDTKHTKAGWKNRMFPNQCLDRILPVADR